MATKRIKFLRREKILQSDIEIRLEVLGLAKQFSAKLNLKDYKFPTDAQVYIDAKQLLERIRFDFGTVGTPRPTTSIDISRLKGERVTFDVLVVDLKNSRKLGSAETVRPTKVGDQKNLPKELLPIDASKHLDGVLWRISYSDNWESSVDAPVLLLDRSATRDSAADFIGNNWVASLVLPSAMREILTRILLIEDHTYAPDSTSWRDAWLRFAIKYAEQELPAIADDHNAQDSDAVEGWINVAVGKMSMQAQFLNNLLKEINR